MRKIKTVYVFLVSIILCMVLIGCGSQASKQGEPELTATSAPTEVPPSAPTATPTPEPTATNTPVPTEAIPEIWQVSTMDIVRDMGIGINLGNTFESFGDWVEK